MSTDNYAEFLTAMGHRVLRTESAWWFDTSKGVLSNFPFHQPVTPSDDELNQALGVAGIAVRYCCPTESGRASYLYACADRDYDLARLSANTRSKIRRGLERCEVRPLAFSELEPLDALAVIRDTDERQDRATPKDHDQYWRKYFLAAQNVPTFETWGALVSGELAAMLISCRIDDCANIFILRSHRKHLKSYPNNALIYTYLRSALARPEITLVSYGWESVQADLESLDSFKLAMGFEKRPIGQRIELNRLLRPMVRGPVLRRLQRFAEARTNRESLAKLAGMLRWYSEQPQRAA